MNKLIFELSHSISNIKGINGLELAKKLCKTAIILTAILTLTACAKKQRGSGMEEEIVDGGGVGDSVTFYGTDLSPEQERRLHAKNTYYFDYDSFQLSEEDTMSIYTHAKKILNKPRAHVRIEGHTDERGSREYNVALGERRAKTIQNILALKGVNPNQVSVVSYGKEKPAQHGNDEAAWSQNRRAIIIYESD